METFFSPRRHLHQRVAVSLESAAANRDIVGQLGDEIVFNAYANDTREAYRKYVFPPMGFRSDFFGL